MNKRELKSWRLDNHYESCRTVHASRFEGQIFTAGMGNPMSKVVFVSDLSESNSLPISGAPSVLLGRMLNQIGMDLSDVFVTSLVKYPFVVADAEEVSRWAPLLRWELDILKPKVVVPMGVLSTSVWFAGRSYEDILGQVYANDGRLAIPLRHPSHVATRQHHVPEFKAGFQAIKDCLAKR